MSIVNINELQEKQRIKNNNKIKCYDAILKKCSNRMKFMSDRSQSCCFFEIPEFVFGIPLFNSHECVRYVVKKLMKEGFMVIYTHPNLLYISWDIEYTQKPKSKDNLQITNNNYQKSRGDNQFKLISDYKPSGKFLEKLNL
jgi:hypothetical protein